MNTDEAREQKSKQAALMSLRRREWVVLAIFLAFALFIAFDFKRVEVTGQSMEPTYHSGDMVIVWKTAPRASLKPGDVIVFKSSDGDELIKRIVYIKPYDGPARFPDWLALSNGRRLGLSVLFNPINSPYFYGRTHGEIPSPSPDRTIFVMGDNLYHSDDSRDFGPISPSQILGKAIP